MKLSQTSKHSTQLDPRGSLWGGFCSDSLRVFFFLRTICTFTHVDACGVCGDHRSPRVSYRWVIVVVCEAWELSSGPLVEQQELLTTKSPPSLSTGGQCSVLFSTPTPFLLSKKCLAGS